MDMFKNGLTRRSFLGLSGAAAAVAGMGLAGCGGGGDEGKGSAPAEGGKVGGGVITAGSAYTTTNFDPSSTSSALACGTNWHVVEGLYGLDFHDYSVFNELAYSMYVYVFRFLIRGRLDLPYYFRNIMLPEIIFTVVTTLLVYRLFLSASRRLEDMGKRRDSTIV